MEEPKELKYRPSPIPFKYKYIISTLDHYGFGKPSFLIEHALNSHAISYIDEILSDPENYEAEGDTEYLQLILKWLQQREKELNRQGAKQK